MNTEFEDWKNDEITKIQNDIEYHEGKLNDLKFKLKVFED